MVMLKKKSYPQRRIDFKPHKSTRRAAAHAAMTSQPAKAVTQDAEAALQDKESLPAHNTASPPEQKKEQEQHDKEQWEAFRSKPKTKLDTKTMDLEQRIAIVEDKVDLMDESWSSVGGQQVHKMKQLEQTVGELQQKLDGLEQANRESRPDVSLIKMGHAELSRHEQLIARLEKLCAHQEKQNERQAEINEELQRDIIHLQGSLGQYR